MHKLHVYQVVSLSVGVPMYVLDCWNGGLFTMAKESYQVTLYLYLEVAVS